MFEDETGQRAARMIANSCRARRSFGALVPEKKGRKSAFRLCQPRRAKTASRIHLLSVGERDFFFFSASADDNECQNVTNICGQRGNCTNTEGSYFCTCLPGYSSTGKAQFTPNDGTECNGTRAPRAPPAGTPTTPLALSIPRRRTDETRDFEDDYRVCHLYFMHAGITALVPKGIKQ